jgi:hypothetical protein
LRLPWKHAIATILLLNLKEYSVGEAPHSRTSTATVDGRELHWMFRDCLNRRVDWGGWPAFWSETTTI